MAENNSFSTIKNYISKGDAECDILFFDEFFLLPVYAVIGAGYAASGSDQIDGNVVNSAERAR